MPPSAGSSCRSRRSPSGSSTPSSRPRTRIFTAITGSTRCRSCAPRSPMSAGCAASRRPIGASTITQQVAKNMLLTNEVSIARKIKEILLATRIEEALPKDRILELYLNEIYLGSGAYGVAAAALTYFDKSLDELTPGRGRVSRRAAEGAEPLQSGALPASGARRAATGCSTAWSRTASSAAAAADAAKAEPIDLRHRRGGRAGQGALFRRGGAARAARALRREGALRGRPVGAHQPRSAPAGGCRQGVARRARSPMITATKAGAARSPISTQAAIGRRHLSAVPVPAVVDRCRLAAGGGAAYRTGCGGDRLRRRRHRDIPFAQMRWARPRYRQRQPRSVPARRRRCRQARRCGDGRTPSPRPRQRRRRQAPMRAAQPTRSRRHATAAGRPPSPCARCRKCRAPSSPWTRIPGACWR